MCVFLFYIIHCICLFVCLNTNYLEFHLPCTMQNLTVDVFMYLLISLFTYLSKKYGNNSEARRQQLRKKVEQKKKKSQPAQSRLI